MEMMTESERNSLFKMTKKFYNDAQSRTSVDFDIDCIKNMIRDKFDPCLKMLLKNKNLHG
jgi:hypothetical protein